MKVRLSEFVEDKNGGHFVHHTREREFPESEGRHDDLCIVCGFPDYPECRQWCSNEKWSQE